MKPLAARDALKLRGDQRVEADVQQVEPCRLQRRQLLAQRHRVRRHRDLPKAVASQRVQRRCEVRTREIISAAELRGSPHFEMHESYTMKRHSCQCLHATYCPYAHRIVQSERYFLRMFRVTFVHLKTRLST